MDGKISPYPWFHAPISVAELQTGSLEKHIGRGLKNLSDSGLIASPIALFPALPPPEERWSR
ncbi:MAG: hypothetical protein ACUVUS_05090 [Thermoproteota archaeon]